MRKLIKKYQPGGITERADATRVQMPRTDVEPVKRSDLDIAIDQRLSEWPQSGAITPVHPEFELALGAYGILGDAVDLFKLGKLGLKKLRSKITKPQGFARIGRSVELPMPNFEEDLLNLPEYATPNSQTEGMELVKGRLETGGKERLKANSSRYTDPDEVSVHYFTPAQEYYDYEFLTDEAVGNVGLNFKDPGYKQQYDFYMKAFHDYPQGFAVAEHKKAYVPDTPNKNVVEPHEVDHLVHYPSEPPQGIDASIMPKSFEDYITGYNGTEVSARGTQLKNYFGLTDDSQEFTEDMLRYAAKHYIADTGMNNNMSEFFASITDYKKLAEWINKHSMVSAGVVGGAALSGNTEKHKKGGLISKYAKGSPVNTNPLPKYQINDNPNKNKLFEIDQRVVGYIPPQYLTFPKGNGRGLYMIKRNE